ncbi:flavin-containing monooxygenase [Rhodococcus sp. 5G237]
MTSIADDHLRDALKVANVPTLQMVLVHLTGDESWIADPFLPTAPAGLSIHDSGGLSHELGARIRDAAFEAILAWQAGKPVALAKPSPEQLRRMASVSLGEEVPSEYVRLIESILYGREMGSTISTDAPPAVPEGFNAIIVGSGPSGIAAAIKLGQMGIPFEVLEKADSVGGSWRENRYPGAGVDTPSHLYSFSFAPHDWSAHFARQDEMLAYLEGIAENFDVLPHVRLGTEVTNCSFDEHTRTWTVQTIDSEGCSSTRHANIVVSAVGAFNPPKYPTIPGAALFDGPIVHTADWPADLDLTGLRVAVIGNGASAMQLVPAIVDKAAHVDIYQRSPQWANPVEKSFSGAIPTELRKLISAVPLYRSWLRIRQAWIFNDKAHASLQVDPSWPTPEISINATNDKMRRYLEKYIRTSLSDRPDLYEKSVPSYPPFGKRMLLDHGWYEALKRPNVELVTDGVAEIRTNSVVSSDGVAREADVIVYATGFDVARFLSTLPVTGRNGLDLRDAWEDDNPKAYLGLTIPDFPNFFTLYGPNTQSGHGGSLIFAVEMQLRYLGDLLTQTFQKGADVVECRKDVYENYADSIDKAHSTMIWSHQGMNTYYRNSRGRVVVNSPWRIVDFWNWTRSVNLDDYVLAGPSGTDGHESTDAS